MNILIINLPLCFSGKQYLQVSLFLKLYVLTFTWTYLYRKGIELHEIGIASKLGTCGYEQGEGQQEDFNEVAAEALEGMCLDPGSSLVTGHQFIWVSLQYLFLLLMLKLILNWNT